MKALRFITLLFIFSCFEISCSRNEKIQLIKKYDILTLDIDASTFFEHGEKYILGEKTLLLLSDAKTRTFNSINLYTKEIKKGERGLGKEWIVAGCTKDKLVITKGENNYFLIDEKYFMGLSEMKAVDRNVFIFHRDYNSGDSLLFMNKINKPKKIDWQDAAINTNKIITADGYFSHGMPDKYIEYENDMIFLRIPKYATTEYFRWNFTKENQILEMKHNNLPAYNVYRLSDYLYLGCLMSSFNGDGSENYYPVFLSSQGEIIQELPNIQMHDGPYINNVDSKPFLINSKKNIMVTFSIKENGIEKNRVVVSVYKMCYPTVKIK